MRFDSLIHEEDLDFAHRLFAELLETDSVGHFELRMRDRAGEIPWFGWSAVISRGVIFATGRDLGEKRRQEEQLRLAEEALAQSRKLKTLGQLTGGVAHGLNNLLAAIHTKLSQLRRQIEAPDARTATLLDNAQASADRGAKLVQHMLAFARRQDLTPRPVNACALLSEMEPLLRSSIGPGAASSRRSMSRTSRPAAMSSSRSRIAVGARMPLKILVVDDDFLVLMGTVGMIEALGHEVLEAANRDAALNQLR